MTRSCFLNSRAMEITKKSLSTVNYTLDAFTRQDVLSPDFLRLRPVRQVFFDSGCGECDIWGIMERTRGEGVDIPERHGTVRESRKLWFVFAAVVLMLFIYVLPTPAQ